MTPTTAFPAPRLASDVTPADVEALVAFLDGKVRGILAGHRSDSDVWKAALGLRLALNHRARQAREAYARADQSRESVRARFLRWNRLAVLALGWEKDADFDERWKVVARPDAEGAAVFAALTGRR
ncbi:hypothetical protein [Streptomyces monashensis]|uniref:Uncharacterized protein n=1 Tax=Streptomyces monashensis TaxID=1678012 RepID=A0A1S2QL49_9ACTN|nr:hypothetical protein [Streptomyces monashensis]OIK06357.1 hypothetical protein BIV23_08170 [Streptomyces monashensis]